MESYAADQESIGRLRVTVTNCIYLAWDVLSTCVLGISLSPQYHTWWYAVSLSKNH